MQPSLCINTCVAKHVSILFSPSLSTVALTKQRNLPGGEKGGKGTKLSLSFLGALDTQTETRKKEKGGGGGEGEKRDTDARARLGRQTRPKRERESCCKWRLTHISTRAFKKGREGLSWKKVHFPFIFQSTSCSFPIYYTAFFSLPGAFSPLCFAPPWGHNNRASFCRFFNPLPTSLPPWLPGSGPGLGRADSLSLPAFSSRREKTRK